MESSGIVAHKFWKHLNNADAASNHLSLPMEFCVKYGHLLPSTVDLKLRNGFVVPVELDRSKGVLNGVLCFFKYLKLKGDEWLLFEYSGRYYLNVYIIGSNCSEMNYPDVIDPFKECIPQLVTIGNGGWRFIWSISKTGNVSDAINPPSQFLDRCGRYLPERVTYLLSNGMKKNGAFCHESRKFSGLVAMFDMAGDRIMDSVHMLMFAFYGGSLIKVSAFDENLYEIFLPGTPLTVDTGDSSQKPGNCSFFEIIVEDKHMSADCYIVEISNKFRNLSKLWEKIQTVNVYTGSGCWMLDIRKRDDYYCSTIVDGWQIMRDCLKLAVGDRLVFECPKDSPDQFSLKVLKNDV